MAPAADNATHHRRAGASVRWSVRLGAAALIAVVILLLTNGSPETHSVSHVIREIHEIVLAQPDGGYVGPWWVSAAEIDPLTGELKAFKVECSWAFIGAKTATVAVDPQTDTFEFDMRDVVVARITGSEEEGDEYDLLEVDRYVLGPIRWSVDIVPDERSTPLGGLRRLRNDSQQRED